MKPLVIEIDSKQTFSYQLLKKARRAYEAGDIGAALYALSTCRSYKHPIPAWLFVVLVDCLCEYLLKQSRGRMGRQARWIEKYRQDFADYLSYQTVSELRQSKIKGDKAYHRAVEILRKDYPNQSGWSFNSVVNGCLRFRRRVKKDPYRYFTAASLLAPSDLKTHFLIQGLLP